MFRPMQRTWGQRVTSGVARTTSVITATVRDLGEDVKDVLRDTATAISSLGRQNSAERPARPSSVDILAAAVGVDTPDVQLGVYTYGAPRVGNHRFGSLLLKGLGGAEYAWRIVCDRDVVVDINPACLGYAHCGTEVVVDAQGNCVLTPSVVERVFRPRRNVVLDHYLDAYTAAIDALMARHEHQGEATAGRGRRLGEKLAEHTPRRSAAAGEDGSPSTPESPEGARRSSGCFVSFQTGPLTVLPAGFTAGLRTSLAFSTSPRRSTRTLLVTPGSHAGSHGLRESVEVGPEPEPEPELEPGAVVSVPPHLAGAQE